MGRGHPGKKAGSREKYAGKYEKDVEFYSFLQFLFLTQWEKLKAYANEKGIEIIGDIPIYVAFDSADTWSNRELFQLDEEGYPIAVAGCPPDAFPQRASSGAILYMTGNIIRKPVLTGG